MKSATEEETANMLQSLFANTKGDKDLFGWLCHSMARHWPLDNDSYQAVVIFDVAKSILEANPAGEWSHGCLQTMSHMVQRKLVAASRSIDVANSACLTWPTHHDTSLADMESSTVPPSIESLVSMMLRVDWNDEDDTAALIILLKVIRTKADADYLIGVCQEILRHQAHGTDEEPDSCFSGWLDTLDEGESSATLSAIVTDMALNDDQRKRVWLQIERQHTTLGQGFFMKVLPTILAFSEAAETIVEIFSFQEDVTSLFTDQDEKYELGKMLLQAFAESDSLAVSKGLARWLYQLNVSGVLGELEAPTEEKIEILSEHFAQTDRFFRELKNRLVKT
jgi:hypothetical protein